MAKDDIEKIINVLQHQNRDDLAELLLNSRSIVKSTDTESTNSIFEIYSPIDQRDRLMRLNIQDRQEINNAISIIYPPDRQFSPSIIDIRFFADMAMTSEPQNNTTNIRVGRLIETVTKELISIQMTPEVMATLIQFGVNVKEYESFDEGEKAIKSLIQKVPEETLLQMVDYFNFIVDEEGNVTKYEIWDRGYFRLFISHNSSHKKFASDLQKALTKYNVSGFVAHNDIEPTKEWQDIIELALKSSDALVALLTSDFDKSKWTDQEIGWSLGRELLIIPVKFNLNPYGFIGKYQALIADGKSPISIASEIVNILVESKQTKERMAKALLHNFEQSNSFIDARNNMTLLEQIKYFDQPFIKRLEYAIKNNTQIKNFFGIPERVTALIEKFRSSV